MKVAFVGIGAMGIPMASLVAKAGFSVTGVDPFPQSRVNAEKIGLAAVESFDKVDNPDVVIAMVATPQQLEGLVDGALARVKGQSWIIMSTVGPECAAKVGETLRQAGARVVDAPVTGGTARAKTGELIIFTAGKPEDVEHVKPILATMGTPRIVGSKLGDGQGVKVINQHLCSIHIVAAAEALNLAGKLGLDQAAILDLVKGGAGGSWMLADRGPRMLMGTDAPVTSTINIFVKDSNLVSKAAASCGADTPLLDIARQRYEAAATAGLAQRDDSRVIETYAKK